MLNGRVLQEPVGQGIDRAQRVAVEIGMRLGFERVLIDGRWVTDSRNLLRVFDTPQEPMDGQAANIVHVFVGPGGIMPGPAPDDMDVAAWVWRPWAGNVVEALIARYAASTHLPATLDAAAPAEWPDASDRPEVRWARCGDARGLFVLPVIRECEARCGVERWTLADAYPGDPNRSGQLYVLTGWRGAEIAAVTMPVNEAAARAAEREVSGGR